MTSVEADVCLQMFYGVAICMDIWNNPIDPICLFSLFTRLQNKEKIWIW
jgi:hypothetical protein